MVKIIGVWMLIVVSFSSVAQTGTSLPRSTPEAEGVSSADYFEIYKSERSK